MALNIHRGINISHWLSQSNRRGAERETWFTQADMERIAKWGFDHIRLPIDEVQMWDESGQPEAEAFGLLESALDWAEQAGLAVVVDLHILRSHFFNQSAEPKLFTDPAESEKFADLWRQLSKRLRGRPNANVAYELMNEAAATDPDDWNRVAMTAFQAIRALEPNRTIVLGSNRWNSVSTFDQLHVPEDKNTILTFHFYHPMLITHHRAGWCPEGKMYNGPVQYPGSPIPSESLSQVVAPKINRLIQLNLDELNKAYNRQSMVADFAKPLAVAQRTGLRLYCGEFGVINLAPQLVREAWYRDLVSVFNECQIDWALWDYKGAFGIIDSEGRSSGIAEVMFQQPQMKPNSCAQSGGVTDEF